MNIEIKIPIGESKNLGAHYNRLMADVKDWVCFLDHDILNLNPNWYNMCITAVQKVGHDAGWITGMTNAIACSLQFKSAAPKNHDIMAHIDFAKGEFNVHGNKLEMMPANVPLPFSGFMILTHREAWEKTGGFMEGFLGVDNDYYKRLASVGYNQYVMPGLYMYHIYAGKKRWFI
jgi:GT2 family glycosyltransferase